MELKIFFGTYFEEILVGIYAMQSVKAGECNVSDTKATFFIMNILRDEKYVS